MIRLIRTVCLTLGLLAWSLPASAQQVISGGGSSSGGGGTPGGTSGQIQYNNAGAFGGFTASGDVTINTGTGAATIANNAVTTAKIANANVTLAKVANAGANSVLVGSAATGSGAAYTEITLGTNLSMAAGVLNATGGGSSATAGVGLAAAPGTCNSGTISTTVSACNDVLTKTGNYTLVNGDGFKTVNCNASGGCIFTIPQATASGNFAEGWGVCFTSQLGPVTLTPTTSTIYAAGTSFAVGQTECVQSDGTNYLGTGGAMPSSLQANTFVTGTIPTVTGTGSPTITTGSTDTAGEVTGGTLATSIVVTFAATKTNAPFCIVTSQSALASFGYTISTTAITISLTATTGEKVDYVCFQH